MLDKSQLQVLDKQQRELHKFDQTAQQWWDPKGQFKRVMAFNQARWQIIEAQIQQHFQPQSDKPAYKALTALDIGCGGGLLCEPLAQLGLNVTGIDGSEMSIEVAKAHARQSGLDIQYHHCLAQQLGADKRYDIVLNTEVIEHVEDQLALVQQCCQLLKPGGLLVMATLNRSVKSYIVAILGAEYVLRMLPKGTHEWRYFVKPDELQQWLEGCGAQSLMTVGLAYNPLTRQWRQTQDLGVNYLLFATSAP